MPQQHCNGDRPPYWSFKTTGRDFDDVFGHLTKETGDAYRELARTLDGCAYTTPCNSGACPTCMQPARVKWTGAVVGLVEHDWGQPHSSQLGFLTFVLPDLFIRPDTLHTFNPRSFKDRIAHVLNRAGLGNVAVVGGIDFALTVVKALGAAHWQPHLHAIMWCPMGVAEAEATLQQHVKISDLVDKPIVIRPLTRALPEVARYTFKAMYWKRKPYISSRTGKSCVRHERLPVWAARELARCLHRIGIEARQFRKNVEWHDGRLRTSAEAQAWSREYRSGDR